VFLLVNPKFVWMNGEFVDWEDATVHVMTPALHYGIAVFEGIRAYWVEDHWNIFRLQEHIKRLFYSASVYRLKIAFDVDSIRRGLSDLIRMNNIRRNLYIRPLVFRSLGGSIASLSSSYDLPTGFSISISLAESILGVEEKFSSYRRFKISSWRRPASDALPIYVKCSANYANSILAGIEIDEANYDGALMLDSRGFVSEGVGANLFIVKDGLLITPPASASILPGITRDAIIHLAEDLDYPLVVRDFTRAELYDADEAFLCGTWSEVTPISEVDGIVFGDGKPGPITRQIAEYYHDVVLGNVSKYSSWIVSVKP